MQIKIKPCDAKTNDAYLTDGYTAVVKDGTNIVAEGIVGCVFTDTAVIDVDFDPAPGREYSIVVESVSNRKRVYPSMPWTLIYKDGVVTERLPESRHDAKAVILPSPAAVEVIQGGPGLAEAGTSGRAKRKTP